MFQSVGPRCSRARVQNVDSPPVSSAGAANCLGDAVSGRCRRDRLAWAASHHHPPRPFRTAQAGIGGQAYLFR